MSRNIVLVSVDSLRADRCRYLAPGVESAATLDRMPREWVVCENVIAPTSSDWSRYSNFWVPAHSETRAPVRTETWKYLTSQDGSELYDLSTDPGETANEPNTTVRGGLERLPERQTGDTNEKHRIAGGMAGMSAGEL